MVDYVQNIKKIEGLENLKTKNKSDLSGTYLFFSFDLVNSTFYKNKVNSWASIFSKFFSFCKAEVSQNYFPNAELWKMVGDEILFYMPISDIIQLKSAPARVFQLMNKSIEMIHEAEVTSKGVLSVKSTMWTAYINDIECVQENNTVYSNILIKERVIDNINLDFLGPDIDIGFRISKYALRNKLVVDAKLACLLTKLNTELDQNNIAESMRIVSYERLKGVWDDRPYPIVWYHDSWNKSDSMFLYDEKFNSPIIQRIIDSKFDSLEQVSRLTKIFSDLNKFEEIEKLQAGAETFKLNNPKGLVSKKIPFDRLCELHLVAICVNEKNKILISRRPQKDDFPEKWEFGCSQLHLGQNFVDAMKEGYEKDFGLELTFCEENPMSIAQYTLTKTKENNRIVPGLIFVANVSESQLKEKNFDSTKHTEFRWISKEEASSIKNEECVPDFHNAIALALEYISKHSQ